MVSDTVAQADGMDRSDLLALPTVFVCLLTCRLVSGAFLWTDALPKGFFAETIGTSTAAACEMTKRQ
jgi:hypothetical protein